MTSLSTLKEKASFSWNGQTSTTLATSLQVGSYIRKISFILLLQQIVLNFESYFPKFLSNILNAVFLYPTPLLLIVLVLLCVIYIGQSIILVIKNIKDDEFPMVELIKIVKKPVNYYSTTATFIKSSSPPRKYSLDNGNTSPGKIDNNQLSNNRSVVYSEGRSGKNDVTTGLMTSYISNNSNNLLNSKDRYNKSAVSSASRSIERSQNLKQNTYKTPIVIDIGNINVRQGYAGASKPTTLSSFPYKQNNDILLTNNRIDANKIEEIWRNIVFKDGVIPSEQPLFITWSPLYNKEDAELLTEIAFEKFNIPAIYFGTEPVLSLYGAGKLSGCSLHSGEKISHSCIVKDGVAVPGSLLVSTRSGSLITKHLIQLLTRYGMSKESVDTNIELIRKYKDQNCECTASIQSYSSNNNSSTATSSTSSSNKTFTLPDGTSFHVTDSESKHFPQKLFLPFAVERNDPLDICIQNIIIDTISTCNNVQEKNFLYENIYISGGNTLLKGFKERIEYEISKLVEDNTALSIRSGKARENMVWLGGSVLASSESFSRHWIHRDEYNELGLPFIHQKCQTELKNV